MTEAERIKIRYWKRKDAGLCTQCGMEPPKPGRNTCTFCAGKRAWTNHLLRERYKQEHRCQNCGKPVTDGHVKCPECREKQSQKERSQYHDDGQIAWLEVKKIYSDCPRVEVIIEQLESRKRYK